MTDFFHIIAFILEVKVAIFLTPRFGISKHIINFKNVLITLIVESCLANVIKEITEYVMSKTINMSKISI